MIGVFIDGLRRVAAAPGFFLVAYAFTLAGATALALAPAQPGSTIAIATLLELSRTFGLDFAGLAVIPPALRGLTGHQAPGVAVHALALAVAGAAGWTFLAGGALDRLARQRRTGAAAFLAACRHHFWPLARLAVLAGALYWLLLGVLHPRLAGDLSGAAAGGLTTGPANDPAGIALHGLFGAGGAAIGLFVDYARIRLVVEDRRSMVGALLAGYRFVRRRPAAVATLWVLNTALLALILAGCALLTPAVDSGSTSWGGVVTAWICIAARLFTTLVAWGSQTAFFQGELAHPTYVARARAVEGVAAGADPSTH